MLCFRLFWLFLIKVYSSCTFWQFLHSCSLFGDVNTRAFCPSKKMLFGLQLLRNAGNTNPTARRTGGLELVDFVKSFGFNMQNDLWEKESTIPNVIVLASLLSTVACRDNWFKIVCYVQLCVNIPVLGSHKDCLFKKKCRDYFWDIYSVGDYDISRSGERKARSNLNKTTSAAEYMWTIMQYMGSVSQKAFATWNAPIKTGGIVSINGSQTRTQKSQRGIANRFIVNIVIFPSEAILHEMMVSSLTFCHHWRSQNCPMF